MNTLSANDLMSLEAYAKARADFRARVMEHKQNRFVQLGPNLTLYFEDRLTMHYQIQEMLRAERIFEAEGIQEELDAYNPLIPDGSNWKATMMVEFGDVDQRKVALAELVDIENRIWVRVGDLPAVRPIADEDLERSTGDKTSAVHFLRFELSPEMVAAVNNGAVVAMGVDHAQYQHVVDPVPDNITASLRLDLD